MQFFGSASAFTAYNLAGTGLIREGARVCVALSQCCK